MYVTYVAHSSVWHLVRFKPQTVELKNVHKYYHKFVCCFIINSIAYKLYNLLFGLYVICCPFHWIRMNNIFTCVTYSFAIRIHFIHFIWYLYPNIFTCSYLGSYFSVMIVILRICSNAKTSEAAEIARWRSSDDFPTTAYPDAFYASLFTYTT